jgi:hypothetical protein
MSPMERLRQLREKAARLRAERPDYPDSPEQIEERRQLAEALHEPQTRAIANQHERGVIHG